jgi:hypothetical protein
VGELVIWLPEPVSATDTQRRGIQANLGAVVNVSAFNFSVIIDLV